jgi:hypothetical protein
MAVIVNVPGLIVVDAVNAADIVGANAPVKIQAIVWDCGASGVTGDRVVLTDTAGNSIFEATMLTSLASAPPAISFAKPLRVRGLKLPTMAHGKIFIYVA